MQAQATTMDAVPGHKPFFKSLYFQVLLAIAAGVLLGHYYPQLGEQMKPLGDAFIKTIKMVIAPIIFCTVVHGIASMQDMRKVGRVGLKALVYFELLTTLARQPGRVFTRAQLLDAIHGVDVDAFERAIDTHIKNIRRKIEPDTRSPTYVLTVYGIGYKFADA